MTKDEFERKAKTLGLSIRYSDKEIPNLNLVSKTITLPKKDFDARQAKHEILHIVTSDLSRIGFINEGFRQELNENSLFQKEAEKASKEVFGIELSRILKHAAPNELITELLAAGKYNQYPEIQRFIIESFRVGKPIPPEILVDYPDLYKEIVMQTQVENSPLRYDPSIGRHNGIKLTRGDILRDNDGNIYQLDRDSGFMLIVDQLNEAGHPIGIRSFSVDPGDKDRYHDLYLTGKNAYEDGYLSETGDKGEKEARRIGDMIGVDWTKIDIKQFQQGLAVELEHGSVDPQTNVTNDDLVMTGKIALAHLKELPDYYTRLAKMEKKPTVNPHSVSTLKYLSSLHT